MELANQGSTSDHASIENLLTEIEATWNSGDLHAYAALYARNASYVSRAGMLVNGRAEIEQLTAADVGHRAARFIGPLPG